MSPVEITRDKMKNVQRSRGLDSPLEISTAFPDTWEGGTWGPRNIAEIEMTASRALLQMAAKFRPRYLRNFYELGRVNNLEPKKDEPRAFIVLGGQARAETVSRFLEILMWQGIEIHQMTNELVYKARSEDRGISRGTARQLSDLC